MPLTDTGYVGWLDSEVVDLVAFLVLGEFLAGLVVVVIDLGEDGVEFFVLHLHIHLRFGDDQRTDGGLCVVVLTAVGVSAPLVVGMGVLQPAVDALVHRHHERLIGLVLLALTDEFGVKQGDDGFDGLGEFIGGDTQRRMPAHLPPFAPDGVPLGRNDLAVDEVACEFVVSAIGGVTLPIDLGVEFALGEFKPLNGMIPIEIVVNDLTAEIDFGTILAHETELLDDFGDESEGGTDIAFCEGLTIPFCGFLYFCHCTCFLWLCLCYCKGHAKLHNSLTFFRKILSPPKSQ